MSAIRHPYNLGRLGHAGDDVCFAAAEEQLAPIAVLAGALWLSRFAVAVALKRPSPDRFVLDYRIEAELAQACVVTLEPVVAQIDRSFRRELRLKGRRPADAAVPPVQEIDLDGPDEPEEIDSLHFDLAGPALEEFLLALEPYPRCPGVEFAPEEDAQDAPQSPFAGLKGLKSSD